MDVNSPTAIVSVTSTSARKLVNSESASDVIFTNRGSYDVFVKEGDSTVTAVFPVTDGAAQLGTLILPGGTESFKKIKDTTQYFAYITETGANTSTLAIKTGNGS